MPHKDRIIRATGAKAPMRLVVIDLTNSMNEIGKRHGAKAYSLKLLAETAVASMFLSSSLKFPGTVSVKMRFSGDISLIQADTTPQGFLRAMIPQQEILDMNQFEPMILPQKFEVVKLDAQGKRIHQSVVEAVQGTIGHNLAAYLLQSEQVRSAVCIEAKVNSHDSSVLDYAVGFMVEAYPDLAERDIAIMEQVVVNIPRMQTFFKDGAFDLDALLDELRGPYDIEVVKSFEPEAYCPCSRERMLSTLATLPEKDLKELAAEPEPLEIICDFCRSKYYIAPIDLRQILADRTKKS